MSVCYIVGAGEFYGTFTPGEDDLVIAADGGYTALSDRGIRCDLLIGDMDSIGCVPTEIKTIRHKVEKDETDMHLAYLEGVRRGYVDFEIYGGVGGRSDHTFANYCLLAYISKHGGRAKLHDKSAVATAVTNGDFVGYAEGGKTVSVFAFGDEARGVSLKGLYYPLEDGSLSPDFPLGVSNHALGGEYRIEAREGTLLVISEI